jgi:hypothetical protein
MDDVVVKEEDLDRVHQHDLALSSEAAELVAVVEGLDAKAIASSVPDVRTRAESFLRSVEARAEVLRQVF